MSHTLTQLQSTLKLLDEKMIDENTFKNFLEELAPKINEGIPPYKLLNISESYLKDQYLLAFELFKGGCFAHASVIFYTLFSFFPRNFAYVYGLGKCYAELKNYNLAILAFGLAHLNDFTNPTPLLNMAECYLKLDQNKEAKDTLEKIVQLEKIEQGHSDIIQKAKLMLNRLI